MSEAEFRSIVMIGFLILFATCGGSIFLHNVAGKVVDDLRKRIEELEKHEL